MAADNDGTPLGKASTISWSDVTSIKEDAVKVSLKNAYAEGTGYTEEKDLPEPPPAKKKKGHTDNSPSRQLSIQKFRARFGFPVTVPKPTNAYDRMVNDKRFEVPKNVNAKKLPTSEFNVKLQDNFGGIAPPKMNMSMHDPFGDIKPKPLKSIGIKVPAILKSKKKNGGLF